MPDEALLDRVLDRSVWAGYTKIGYHLRRRHWDDLPADAMGGKRVLITGATSGIGRAAARRCAELGATVHVLGHNPERGEEALRSLEGEVPAGTFVLERCDLRSLPDVRRFCDDLADRVPTLHGLAHNAGVMAPDRSETDEGHELTLAAHVLGPHLMTRRLVPLLAAPDTARIVFMSSGGMYPQRLAADDLEFRDGKYSGTAAYARTKRMQVVLAERWAEVLAGDPATSGIGVHAMHPGWVDTSGVRTYLPKFRTITRPVIRGADQGADTLVWLLAAERLDPATGGFWHDRQARPTHYLGRTRETPAERGRFWDACEAAVAPYA